MKTYPLEATEKFDNANFHIKYCLYFLKKYLFGDVLEVGAGCGSFTKNYYNGKIKNILLTELDKKNIRSLKSRFKNFKNIKVSNNSIKNIKGKFETILYFHVLEHIKDDRKELINAKKKLKKNGHLIIIVPAGKKIYSNLDKAVGHYRRYEKKFFKKEMFNLKRDCLYLLDGLGYLLYFLNKLIFKKEVFPSKLKIFIWDKIFTPLTIVLDYLTNYNFGKCILVVYKKS